MQEKENIVVCQHQWWNLVHVICCMKCGAGMLTLLVREGCGPLGWSDLQIL
jgi:hypothetical protein